MKTGALESLNGSEELEAAVERVLTRMLADGEGNVDASSLEDDASTRLLSKITVPTDVIIAGAKTVESGRQMNNLVPGDPVSRIVLPNEMGTLEQCFVILTP